MVLSEKFSSEKCNDVIKKSQISHNVSKVQSKLLNIGTQYSFYLHLIRMTAWFIRFFHNRTTKGFKPPNELNLILQPEELEYAKICLIRKSQLMHYPVEYNLLSKGLSLPNTSNLLKLNPIMDPESLCLRVGGRLKHANLSYYEKYPYILSPKSSLAKVIIRDIHLKSLHGINQLTLSLVREFLWIPNARNLVKTIITQCV